MPADDHGGSGNDFIYNIQPNSMPIQWSPVRRYAHFTLRLTHSPVRRSHGEQ